MHQKASESIRKDFAQSPLSFETSSWYQSYKLNRTFLSDPSLMVTETNPSPTPSPMLDDGATHLEAPTTAPSLVITNITSLINATLSESILLYIVGISSSKKAWDVLKQCEEDLILYVLNGLPPSYCKFGSSVCIRAHTAELSLPELHTLLTWDELALANETSQDPHIAYVVARPGKPHLGHGSPSFRGQTSSGCSGHHSQRHQHSSHDSGLFPTPATSQAGMTNTRP
ncbi:hypothetical protein NE237_014723 [Protea cynaroides]|uniref:Uncharacterized protein n=1 Tax=Protea cynaroides TaxID=273540 RepID=A0A9Q0QQC3_9MAGN|nr:hypothetical protein NE237_014723 [Protea cynaroides]